MRPVLSRYAVSISAAALLAACGGSQPQVGAPGAMRATTLPYANSTPTKNVKSGYLYVSNRNADQVVLFSYVPKTMTATAIGQFTFDSSTREPAGSCSDAKGNVYVVGSAGTGDTGTITEFAFGTVTPIQTLSDDSGPPTGCSVDPTTGNLAVTNYNSNSYSIAQVLIYENGSGNPKQIDACYYNGTAGYDPSGNLWLECDGGYNSPASIEELPKGGSSFQPVTFNESFDYMGAIQWDGKYLDVSFANVSRTNLWTMGIYQTTVSGSGLTTVNTISLQKRGGGSKCRSGLVFFQWAMVSNKANDLPRRKATQLIAANGFCSMLAVWKYPKGGRAVRVIKAPGQYYGFYPYGATYVTR